MLGLSTGGHLLHARLRSIGRLRLTHHRLIHGWHRCVAVVRLSTIHGHLCRRRRLLLRCRGRKPGSHRTGKRDRHGFHHRPLRFRRHRVGCYAGHRRGHLGTRLHDRMAIGIHSWHALHGLLVTGLLDHAVRRRRYGHVRRGLGKCRRLNALVVNLRGESRRLHLRIRCGCVGARQDVAGRLTNHNVTAGRGENRHQADFGLRTADVVPADPHAV